MTTTTLHYLYDPLCGWCYAAAPLVKAAREILSVRPHGGGMMAGANRQAVTPQLRAYVRQHDARIAQLTGQRFGSGYADGLLNDIGTVLDSEPPTAAMLAAEEIAGRGLDMLAQLQITHYVEGRHISERAVLIAVGEELGLDPVVFAGALDRQSGNVIQAHFRETRALMAEVGAQGFPTLLLQSDDGLQIVDFAAYLARPNDFGDWLRRQTEATPAMPSSGESLRCDANGCVI
ncbi:DsbA family protein [uncultured Propionivibrio sp.]|uniref:DsbA family protein n=1 Tax=uncultured Propionivibrio sp. TaxID=426737 RepID=UPI0029C01F4B|nr:DsbA family protein [uncultured Propionivibrio sp.]